MKQTFTIQEVEAKTNVPAATLRQWERRYQFPQPERSDNGYRLYSQRDVQNIETMKGYIENGMPSSRAAKLVQHQMQEIQSPETDTSLQGFCQALTQAFLDLDEAKANQILSKAHALHSSHDIFVQVMQKSVTHLGERWHAGTLDIATEHFASNYVQARLRSLLTSQPEHATSPTVIVACGPQEHHELGALMLAVLLRQAAHHVIYLGADTPLKDLRELSERLKPTAILISVTTQEALAYIKQGQAQLAHLAPVVALGGKAFAHEADFRLSTNLKLIKANAQEAVAQLKGYIQNAENMLSLA